MKSKTGTSTQTSTGNHLYRILQWFAKAQPDRNLVLLTPSLPSPGRNERFARAPSGGCARYERLSRSSFEWLSSLPFFIAFEVRVRCCARASVAFGVRPIAPFVVQPGAPIVACCSQEPLVAWGPRSRK